MEVMGKVRNWEEVGDFLGVSESKRDEIKQQLSNEGEKSRQLGEYWVSVDPSASWERLANALYKNGEEKAAVMVKQYLQKGIHIRLKLVHVVHTVLDHCLCIPSHQYITCANKTHTN